MQRIRPKPLSTPARISVVIPCYNYGRYLRGCVESALGQAGVTVSVVIVDDASSDETARVCAEFAGDPRVTVIRHAENRGMIQTFNDGLAAVTDEYVTLVSADDLLAPGALARAVAVLQARPDVGLVYGFAPVFADQPPKPQRRSRPWMWTVWTGEEWLEQVFRRGRNVMHSPEAVLRTSLIRQIGGYEPTMRHTSDLFMWLCAAARANVAYVDGCDQAYYRRHGSNMSTTLFRGSATDITQRHLTFELFVQRHERYRGLYPKAASALSREALKAAALADGEDSAALADLATRLWPQVQATRAWRAHQRHRARGPARRRTPARPVAGALRRLVFRLGRRLNLRRFLHFGVPMAPAPEP